MDVPYDFDLFRHLAVIKRGEEPHHFDHAGITVGSRYDVVLKNQATVLVSFADILTNRITIHDVFLHVIPVS